MWYDEWSAYRNADKIGALKEYREFIGKYPASDRCADAAKAAAARVEKGEYQAEWPAMLRALGQNNCAGAADVFKDALKFPVAEVRVAASGGLLRLSAPAGGNPKQPVTPSDLDSIVGQAITDPEPMVRANLRCVASLNNRRDRFDESGEESPYVLEADKGCAQRDFPALYGRH
jgi:hypothetical protein